MFIKEKETAAAIIMDVEEKNEEPATKKMRMEPAMRSPKSPKTITAIGTNLEGSINMLTGTSIQ